MSVYKNDKVDYVKIAIDSILNQTLKPNQYVIMIDGPIDDELKNLLLYYEKKEDIIELHFREENKGLGITLNEGLSFCKYEYVARMDADDFSEKNRFEVQMKFLSENENVSVLGCAISEYDEKLSILENYKEVPNKCDEIKKYIKRRNPMNHPTVIFKKKDVLDSGSYENYLYFEDYYLWAKMLSKGYNLCNLNQFLYKFRGGKSMYGRRGGIKYIKYILKIENGLVKLKIINLADYLRNIIVRCLGAIIPTQIRIVAYKLILRKSGRIYDEK